MGSSSTRFFFPAEVGDVSSVFTMAQWMVVDGNKGLLPDKVGPQMSVCIRICT
jgi:hypothetical protein